MSDDKAVAWQRRQQYSDIPGYVPQWQFVSKEEATGHFERLAGYEYRPLYTRPSEQAVTEAQPDPIELVREKIESLSKGKDAAEYVIATMVTNLKAGNVTTSQLLEWFESEGRAALKAAMEADR